MLYKGVVGEAQYKVIDIMKLPMEVIDSLAKDQPGNDKANIINPKYFPKLAEWLKTNGYSDTDCYIAWWCW